MLAFAVVLVAAVPGIARAVTLDDVVALSKAGLADSVLVAVIDADRTVFTLTPQQVLELRNAGVSNAVLVKMLGSAREFAGGLPPDLPPPVVTAAPAPPSDSGYLAYGPEYAPATIVVPYYVPIAVPTHHGRPHVHPPSAAGAARHVAPPTVTQTGGFGRFINDGWNSGTSAGGFLNDGWITATPSTQTRTTPPPIRTLPPARETPPPARVTPPSLR